MLKKDTLATHAVSVPLPFVIKSKFHYLANDFVSILAAEGVTINNKYLGYFDAHYYHLLYNGEIPGDKPILSKLLNKEQKDFYNLDFFNKRLSQEDFNLLLE